ncbi:MAG: asparagine--tRNA ligase [Candidatus Aenigmarchaeota archaeon]|nr:asparagine--tRNA ligase [Candidatus Aenigmarchaeota archaeon]
MQFLSISQAMKQGSGLVKIRGWCYRQRSSNKFIFIVLRDSTDIIQCVVSKDKVNEKTWKDADKVRIEFSLEIEGTIKEDKRAPTGYEIDVSKLHIVAPSETFPITKDKSTEFLLDVRHLWLRSRQMTDIMKVRSAVLEACNEFFKKEGYYETAPPIITGSSCEGGSTQFEIKYFDEKAYLSQSAQLYLEALIFSLEKVWALTPSFRAEPSRTQRHLAEYWHCEMEAAWMGFEGLQKFEEEMISFICQYAAKNAGGQLSALGRKPADLKKVKPPFPRLSYDEALKELAKKGHKVKWGEDLRTEEERLLTEKLTKPLIVTQYPKAIKAFYMKEDPKNAKLVLCNDVLAPEGFGEIIGGSERETDNAKLIKRLKEAGESTKDYQWYLDLRKYGSVPHSGFGLGIERVVRWLCKLESIRDAIPFPRTIARKYP